MSEREREKKGKKNNSKGARKKYCISSSIIVCIRPDAQAITIGCNMHIAQYVCAVSQQQQALGTQAFFDTTQHLLFSLRPKCVLFCH